jgi:hypothetical protein
MDMPEMFYPFNYIRHIREYKCFLNELLILKWLKENGYA